MGWRHMQPGAPPAPNAEMEKQKAQAEVLRRRKPKHGPPPGPPMPAAGEEKGEECP